MAAKVSEKMDGKLVIADNRGRIALGTDASTKAFTVKHEPNGDYVLTPMVHVPAREAWLWYENESRASFERGVADIQAGRVKEVDFSEYLLPDESDDTENAAK
jgi:hypothetical protein